MSITNIVGVIDHYQKRKIYFIGGGHLNDTGDYDIKIELNVSFLLNNEDLYKKLIKSIQNDEQMEIYDNENRYSIIKIHKGGRIDIWIKGISGNTEITITEPKLKMELCQSIIKVINKNIND